MKNTNLIIGKPDSGKTRGYMFNQVKEMISNGEKLFIWDNKEEYYNYFYNDLKDSHYTIKMVRLDEPENSNGFNILSIPYSLYKNGNVDKALLLIQELGVSMVNTSDNVTDFWDNNARDLLCSLILLLFKEGKKEEINFYSIVNLLRKIDEDHIIFINFEFIEFEELLDYKKLNKFIKDKIQDNKIYYLFLDEIQNVDNFEKVVNSLRASIKNISIFLTGSNSKMLSDELSSLFLLDKSVCVISDIVKLVGLILCSIVRFVIN